MPAISNRVALQHPRDYSFLSALPILAVFDRDERQLVMALPFPQDVSTLSLSPEAASSAVAAPAVSRALGVVPLMVSARLLHLLNAAAVPATFPSDLTSSI